MDCQSVSTSSATTGSPKPSWADILDDDIEHEALPSWDEAAPWSGDAEGSEGSSSGPGQPSRRRRGRGAEPQEPTAERRSQRERPRQRERRRAPATPPPTPSAPRGAPETPPTAAKRRGGSQLSARRPGQWNWNSGAVAPQNSYAMSTSGVFPVEVDAIPLRLCNDACIEAMLHQAGLQEFVVECQTSEGEDGTGSAVIKLSTWHAAAKCHNHFATSSWSTGALKVRMGSAQVNEDANPAAVAAVAAPAPPASPAGAGVPCVRGLAAGVGVPIMMAPVGEAAWMGGCYYAAMPCFPYMPQGSVVA